MTHNVGTPCPETGPRPTVTRLVTAGLDRTTGLIRHTADQRPSTPEGQRTRARRMQVLHSREARWWSVLERAAVADHTLAIVYLRAVVHAGGIAEEKARFWREAAEDWAAISEGRPTSDAAGAMSNWHTLDVAELGRPHLAETIGANQ